MSKLRIFIAIPPGTLPEEIEDGSAILSVSTRPGGVVKGWPCFVVTIEVPWSVPDAVILPAAAAVPLGGDRE